MMDDLSEEEVVDVLISLHNIAGERSDFVGGIDNESLDFSQLEHFINNDTDSDQSYFGDTLSHENNGSHLSPNIGATLSNNIDQNAVHHTQVSHQHILNKNQVSSVQIVPENSYDTSMHNLALNSATTYSHSHLPESPPDSGSEPPYSPQDGATQSTLQKAANNASIQEVLLNVNGAAGGSGLMSMSYVNSPVQQTIQLQKPCGRTILLQNSSVLTPLLTQQQQQQSVISSPLSPSGVNTSCDNRSIGQSHSNLNAGDPSNYVTSLNPSKKRKASQDSHNSNIHVKQEPEAPSSHAAALASAQAVSNPVAKNDDDFGYQDGNGNGSSSDSGMYVDSNFQCIRFQPFQQTGWHTLCDQNLKELPVPHYRVDADKGFNFSNADDAFVCQKKNHFQITCHAQLEGDAQFVKTSEGIRKISSFHLHFYGVKVESPTQMIKVEQSQSDRSKKSFHPVLIDLRSDQVTKVTVGRLHFSETTSNNMRKKGKPNPDQRYFYLVVGLHAHCSDTNFPIISHSSERIIVRASNPGQFESDVELCWQRGSSPESVFHAGRVGINTDRPDEALVVHGNLKLSGHVLKSSDMRVKTNIKQCDSREQLRNIQQLNIVQFTYSPEFSTHFGLINVYDTGVIAQDIQKILPDAVRNAGSVVLANGQKLDNFLLVDKERIYMENVGAVKELCKVTNNLESRIDELERMNKKLVRMRRQDSFRSTSSYSTITSRNSMKLKRRSLVSCCNFNFCSNRYLKALVVILTFGVVICLASVATMYFSESRETYSLNLSNIYNDGKLNRSRSQTLYEDLRWNHNYDFLENGFNLTDPKFLLNTYHRHNKTQGKDISNVSSRIDYQSGFLDSAASSSNYKITKHKMKPSVPVGTQHSQMNLDDFTDDNFNTNDLLSSTLGRPSNCNAISSTDNSGSHYLDSPSPCPVFCCSPGISHNSGDENDDSSQDSSKYSSSDIGNVGQVTRAGYLLEDTPASSFASKDAAISSHGHDQHLNIKQESWLKPINVNKNTIDILGTHNRKRRSNREAESASHLSQEVQTNITVSVYGTGFNETMNALYCYADSPLYLQCKRNSAVNTSYIIPISKYLPDSNILISFKLSKSSNFSKMARCASDFDNLNVECPVKNHEIYWMKSEEEKGKLKKELVENVGRNETYFSIDISESLIIYEKYRVSMNNDDTILDLCQLPDNQLGIVYLEYNIYFQRSCDE